MFEQNQNLSSNQTLATQVPSVAPVTENTVSFEQVAVSQPKSKLWLYVLLVLILVLLGSGGWWYYAKGQVMLLAKNMTWKSDGNYKMSQILNVDLSNIVTPASERGTINLIDFKKASIKLDGAVDVVGDKLDGQTNLVFSGDDKDIKFSLKYKKIDKNVYLSIDSQDDWLKMIPLDLNSTWISVDQEALQANPLLQGKPNDYMPSFKDWSQKNNVFLQNIKDKKLIILSDPHQTKEVAGVKLKKMDFNISPDKIDEFLLTSIDAFADPSTAIEMKKNFETYKTSEADNWSNMQDLIKATTFSFWVDPKSKNIVGMDFALANFDLKNKNEHFFNLTLNFSQTIENIESKDIVVPENVMSLEELVDMLFSGFGASSSNKLGSFTSEQLSEVGDGINNAIQICSRANKKLNTPGKEGVKICDVEGVVDWPYLPSGYQWSKHFFSDGLSFNVCFFSEDLPGITCTEAGCFAGACQENISMCEGLDGTECVGVQVDSDGDGLSDTEESVVGTNPKLADTDGDGYLDGDEVKNGYNPLGAGKL